MENIDQDLPLNELADIAIDSMKILEDNRHIRVKSSEGDDTEGA